MFCPDSPFSNLWVAKWMSECHFKCVEAFTWTALLTICGLIQFYSYKEYSVQLPPELIPNSKLFYIQVVITGLLPLLEVLKLFFEFFYIQMGVIYYYQVIYMFVIIFVFTLSAKLTFVERNNYLAFNAIYGHSLILVIFWTLMFGVKSLIIYTLIKEDRWLKFQNEESKVEFGFFAATYVLNFLLLILGLISPGITPLKSISAYSYIDRHGLLVPQWIKVVRKLNLITPFIWSKKNLTIQLKVVVCLLLTVACRVINVYTPLYSATIVNSFMTVPLVIQWDLIFTYIGILFLRGNFGLGFLESFRDGLWIQVQQYTEQELQGILFGHLFNLSLNWHSTQESNDLLNTLNDGIESIHSLFASLFFNTGPIVLDIIIAAIFFTVYFNWMMAFIIIISIVIYIAFTINITDRKIKFQEETKILNTKMQDFCFESLHRLETVKYYCAEEYEFQTYKQLVMTYQNEEFKMRVSSVILGAFQNIIVCSGLLAMTCIYFTTDFKNFTVSDYVLFTMYVSQLYASLGDFDTFHRVTQKNFENILKLADLMILKPDVVDVSNAEEFQTNHYTVEFKNVSFSYEYHQPILKNLSFVATPGKTLALVGPSGGGKSTIAKLLFRLHEVDSGSILIGDKDIKTVTRSSFRKFVGVAPQKVMILDKSIKFNINYGKLDANDLDVIDSAIAAELHNYITKLPNEYDTKIGDKGFKLDDADAQQVAIARALIKSPPIVVLDEVTDALNYITEKRIQMSLFENFPDRVTIIITNKLSTVTDADEILVLDEGEISEKGKHQQLLDLNGWYAKMWFLQQPRANNDSKPDKDNCKKLDSTPSVDERPNYMYSRPKSTRFFRQY